jgi:hypothetical protein
MKIFTGPSSREETHGWIGGEAAVGTQAERHVRSREQRMESLAAIILGLAFVGGFALAGALCRLTGGRR